MRARPDWRFAVVLMAVVLVVGLVVVLAQGPQTARLFGIEVAKSATAEECEDAAAGGADAQDEADTQDGDDDQGADDGGADAQEDCDEAEGGGGDSARNGGQENGGQENGRQENGDGADAEQGGGGDANAENGQDEAGQDENGQDDAEQNDAGDANDGGDQEFAGRDQIGRASQDEYVDIQSVESNSGVGEGGDFSGGSYSIECALSAHKNSDNPIIAPGVRNGAQHTHDYAGNESTNFASDSDSLAEAGTTCTNGDQHPFFWPVLRDLNGTGPDVGADGGSLDGNVGSFIEPSEVTYEFRGHGSRTTEPMPLNLVLSTGAAKAATADGEGANAKYSCSGLEDRVTDQYPLCPEGSSLQRIFDFPSCWNGQDLDSEDHISHLVFPDEQGECESDDVPVPAARVTVSYDVPDGRSFAIDSFPEQQHDPITDHALFENLTSEQRAQDGAACINANQTCLQGAAENVAFTGEARDQVPPSMTFAHALESHAPIGAQERRAAPELSTAQSATMLASAAAAMVVASLGAGPRLVARLALDAWRRPDSTTIRRREPGEDR